VSTAVGTVAFINAKRFPRLIASIPDRLPSPLRRMFQPVPNPEQHPSFYVQNAYCGGVLFIAGGLYVIVSAILGWG
jgi:hypothetical protein